MDNRRIDFYSYEYKKHDIENIFTHKIYFLMHFYRFPSIRIFNFSRILEFFYHDKHLFFYINNNRKFYFKRLNEKYNYHNGTTCEIEYVKHTGKLARMRRNLKYFFLNDI